MTLNAAHNSALKYSEKDVLAALDLIDIERLQVEEEGLKKFVWLAWHQIQSGKGYQDQYGIWRPVWGWYLDAICEHYDAFITGDIQYLLVNVPPRSAKSTTGAVGAPVYAWTRIPSLQFLTLSYRDDLSIRDSVRSRRLIQSKWYQDRWGHLFSLAGDQNQKSRYENNCGGHRIAQSVGSGSTGEGGDRIMVDDPHNTKQAESEVERQNVVDWWDEGISSRGNDPNESGFCVTMQRLHDRDLSGHILAGEGDYVHLMLPLEYEPDRKCVTVYHKTEVKTIKRENGEVRELTVRNRKIFKDPRKVFGESLNKKRWNRKGIGKLKARMSIYGQAGQLQQRPAPRKGGMFKVETIEVIDALPTNIGPPVRYWDKQGTDSKIAKGRGAFTAGVKLCRILTGPYKLKFLILDVVRGQWSSGPRENTIKNVAQMDGGGTRVWVEQEPGSGGKESAENTVKNLAGYRVKTDRPTGDKVVRAEPLANQTEVGNVLLLKGSWNQEFLDELRNFPAGSKKDQVDAASGAFNKLVEGGDMGLVW